MSKHSWVCKDCGNKEEFFASAVEYHTWIVDSSGDFLRDVDCNDSDHVEVSSCAKCHSQNISWEEVGEVNHA